MSTGVSNGDEGEEDGPLSGTIYGFEPLEWQEGFIHSTAREVLGSGAFGSGKTRGLNERMVILLTAYPGNVGLLCRNTLKALRNTTLKNLYDEVLPRSWIVDEFTNQQKQVMAIQSPFYPASYCPHCGFESQARVHTTTVTCPECEREILEAVPASLLYYDGLQTTDQGEIPENILSLELGAIGVDEAKDITEDAWKALNGRLRLERLNNPYVPKLPIRTIFSATNPADPNHWLYTRFYEEPRKGEVYESTTEDNLANLPTDYMGTLKDQYGEDTTAARRYILGKWEGYEGLVYDEWRDEIHVIDPLDVPEVLGDGWTVANEDELRETEERTSSQVGNPKKAGEYTPARIYPPEDVPIVIGVDWGYRPDPLVIHWWALTPTHGFVLYREWFKTRQLPDDAAKEAMDLMAVHESNNVKRVFADHDSGDREAWLRGAREYVEDRIEAEEVDAKDAKEWRRMQTTAASKDREQGVQEVQRKIRPDENNRAELHMVRGARAHQVDRHLANEDKPGRTLEEIRSYGYESEDSADPQDGNDHGMDTMRYVVFSTKKKGRGLWDDTGTTAVIKR